MTVRYGDDKGGLLCQREQMKSINPDIKNIIFGSEEGDPTSDVRDEGPKEDVGDSKRVLTRELAYQIVLGTTVKSQPREECCSRKC